MRVARQQSRNAPVLCLLLITILGAAVFAHARAASPLVVDLSDREIAITTGFTGASLLLFGVIDQPGDVVVVVRGPAREEVVRRKERIAAIWVNTRSMRFGNVPGYLSVASTRPLSAIAAPGVLAKAEIGTANLRLTAPIDAEPRRRATYRAALIRNMERAGLYRQGPGDVAVQDGRLFRTRLQFPANVPTGLYSADVYLFRNGAIVSQSSTPLSVQKAGLEADIYSFAHRHTILHGIIAILIALVAGWLAGVVFRKA